MVQSLHLVAVAVALTAALLAAAHNLFVRRGTEDGRALHAVYVVVLVNLGVLLPVVGVAYYPDYGLTTTSLVAFVAAGLVATMLARLLNYTSISTIGASRTAPIISTWALVSTALGVVFLDETLVPVHGLGILLAVAGVAVIAWETSHENPQDLPRRELLLGLVIPAGGAVAYGWEPILANVGFAEGTPAPVGLLVKSAAAAVAFTAYMAYTDDLPSPALVRSSDGRWFLLAGLLSTLFLLGYYTALTLAPVNVVTPILTSNTLFVVVLSAMFMPERLERVTPTLVAAAVVVVVGVLLITVFG